MQRINRDIAIAILGGYRAVADKIGLTHQAVRAWPQTLIGKNAICVQYIALREGKNLESAIIRD